MSRLVPARFLTEQTYSPGWDLEAVGMKSSFPFSCTPMGMGLPSAIVQLTLRTPLPPASQNILTVSPSLTVIEDRLIVAEGGSVNNFGT